ncbi:hypothetical protein TNCV_4015971 [Trichonephila clavipes]|nr:hypothetical protein TNCV_4015971 [Trichonephila clavipes]
MSPFLVLREWDNRNRWRDGQVCPNVGQGIMAPWFQITRPMKIHDVEGMIHVKSVEVQSLRVVVWCENLINEFPDPMSLLSLDQRSE